jgi:hypothetical protein
MNEVVYTFYVENNAVAEDSLTPTIIKMIDIVDGTNVSNPPSITELSDGFYKFSFTWEASSSAVGYLIKIDTGDLESNTEATRYVTMRIEPNDYLSATAADIKTSADSIVSSAETLVGNSNRILDIEHGTWKIEGTELVLYAAGFGRAAGTVIGRYDLLDESGSPTSTNPYQRILRTLVTVP